MTNIAELQRAQSANNIEYFYKDVVGNSTTYQLVSDDTREYLGAYVYPDQFNTGQILMGSVYLLTYAQALLLPKGELTWIPLRDLSKVYVIGGSEDSENTQTIHILAFY
ncbi:MAG TPA: hypothetical protein VMZ29_09295 [Candidatus Bathyarchaeia archaeon]|nr:hypothetical protein [Candidatus Bathyarchaeia archaeon]